MIRDYFLGGNTNKGFFSYYDYLADGEKFNRVYIIKGGPGTGKSTTMKAVAKWGEEKGFDVDYIHCSSDPDSLDGVVIPKIGVAMVDGTAPHIVDPKNAGAVEVILNMGDFWDENAISAHKKEIMDCNRQISARFSEAYNYLAAAGELHKNCIKAPDEKTVRETVTNLLSEVSFASSDGSGRVRKLFAEAITPDGVISYADSFAYENRIVLKSEISGAAVAVMSVLKNKLTEMGYDLEVLYSPLNPAEEIRHIIVPEENLCILTSDICSLVNEKNAKVIDADALVSKKIQAADFFKCKLFAMTLIQQAVRVISSAKKLHDKLESYYVPNIDFEAMKKRRKGIFDELELLAQEIMQ